MGQGLVDTLSAPSPYSKQEMVGDYARELSRYKTAAMSSDVAGDTTSPLGAPGVTGSPSTVADAQVQPDDWRAAFRVEVTAKRLTPSERLVLAMENFSDELSGRVDGYYSNLQNRAIDERSAIRYVAGALGRPLAKGATDAVRGAAGLLGLATNPRTQIATLQAAGDAVTNPAATGQRVSSAVESFLAKPVAEQGEAALQFLAGSAVAAVPGKVVGAIDDLAALRSAVRSPDHFDPADPEANGADGSVILGSAGTAGAADSALPLSNRPAPLTGPTARLSDLNANLDPALDHYCTECALGMRDAAGGQGKVVIFASPDYQWPSGYGWGLGGDEIRVPGQNGPLDFAYHSVYTDGHYFYDPLLSDVPVPKRDYMGMLGDLNPSGVSWRLYEPNQPTPYIPTLHKGGF